MPIIEQVKSQLSACRGRWPDVASGSGVPVSTVRKIAQGVSKDPGVRTVQRLLDYFERQGKLKEAA
jgi:predicted transcriptional regulator